MHSPPHPLPTSYHLHVNFPTGIIKSYFKNLRKPLEVSVLHFYLMKFIFLKESENILFFPFFSFPISSVLFSCSVMPYSLRPRVLQQARPPCPSPTPGVYSNSCLLWRRQWQPTPVLLPGKSQGQRSLVGCSPWGRWVGHN